GNTILITGGTSGIGLAFAKEFVQLQNEVIICGRRENRLTAIKEKFPGIITRVCDIATAAEREALASWVLENYPGINMLINNAGIQLKIDLTNKIDIDQVRQEVETNFIAPVHLTSLFAQQLKQKDEAAIINISSGLAFTPMASVAVYGATKAAIHSITLSLRYQLRNTPVKVFEIAPPAVDTELGYQSRHDIHQTHGGISVDIFIEKAIEAIRNDELEVAIDTAKHLHERREELFSMLNR
ncbi:MAG TPA: SDR family oxidoreductase, partial [Chitinophagaceae bacterium]